MAENKVAPMYQKKQATAQQAEAVVDALMKVFNRPQLLGRLLPKILLAIRPLTRRCLRRSLRLVRSLFSSGYPGCMHALKAYQRL